MEYCVVGPLAVLLLDANEVVSRKWLIDAALDAFIDRVLGPRPPRRCPRS